MHDWFNHFRNCSSVLWIAFGLYLEGEEDLIRKEREVEWECGQRRKGGLSRGDG